MGREIKNKNKFGHGPQDKWSSKKQTYSKSINYIILSCKLRTKTTFNHVMGVKTHSFAMGWTWNYTTIITFELKLKKGRHPQLFI